MKDKTSYSSNSEKFAIRTIQAIEVLDSRGVPTIEVMVELVSGFRGFGIAPSGASTGKMEATELRDRDQGRYFGKGVRKAIGSVNGPILNALTGADAREVRLIDKTLVEIDGTSDKSSLGGNAMLATSIACAKAAAGASDIPLFSFLGNLNSHTLPVPMINILNGGAHANNKLAIQEFMIMPVQASTFSEAVRIGAEIFHNLKKILSTNGHSTAVGDEGGFAPSLTSSHEALDCIMSAIKASGLEGGEDVVIALDCAGSSFYDEKAKTYSIDDKILSPEELEEHYAGLIASYPIFSMEDPFFEEDHESFRALSRKYSDSLQVVGDDIFCTNIKLIETGIRKGLANAVLIKPNQVGTISEAFKASELAIRNGLGTVASHRSGETEDTSISHFAVASGARQVKVGSLSRTDRVAKYNELIRIESHLGDDAEYLGNNVLDLSFRK